MVCVAACFGATQSAASADNNQANEEFRVGGEHPRLLLRTQKLRLLRRERERQSLRWQQFDLLMRGRAQMPEPGFAGAFYYQVTGDRTLGTQAVEWALGPGTDLRQLALVFDWCQVLLNETQSTALADRSGGWSTRMPGRRTPSLYGPAPLPRLRWRTTVRTCRPESSAESSNSGGERAWRQR